MNPALLIGLRKYALPVGSEGIEDALLFYLQKMSCPWYQRASFKPYRPAMFNQPWVLTQRPRPASSELAAESSFSVHSLMS